MCSSPRSQFPIRFRVSCAPRAVRASPPPEPRRAHDESESEPRLVVWLARASAASTSRTPRRPPACSAPAHVAVEAKRAQQRIDVADPRVISNASRGRRVRDAARTGPRAPPDPRRRGTAARTIALDPRGAPQQRARAIDASSAGARFSVSSAAARRSSAGAVAGGVAAHRASSSSANRWPAASCSGSVNSSGEWLMPSGSERTA